MEGRGPADRNVTTLGRSSLIPARPGIRHQSGRADWLSAGARANAIGLVLALVLALPIVLFPGFVAAQKQRVVNYYNWSDYQDPTVLDEFTKETGIAVRFDTFDSNDTLEAKLLAGQSGYDVVVPSAYFLSRQIKAGIFRRLDKAKLPNLKYAWPEIAKQLAVYDPGNDYAINYMWGTTGIGYNVKAVKRILGPDGAIDTWDYIFSPEKIAKFKNCGIHLLDSSDDIMSAGLHYLHLDPNTSDPGDLNKVTELLLKIRPYVRKFHSSEYLNALATGEICLVVGFSGDVKQAQKRAAEAKGGIEIGYSIPKEGAQLWFDNLAVPKDAPHPEEAHELINYLIRPDVAAKNTNYVSYANGDVPSDLIDKAIRDDPTVYPDAATMAKLYTIVAHDQKTQRLINRLWIRIKTGQ
ncbi:MAG TPA: polyamine ABC transporter substrate-binding protein [Xanthobacteraceae bacterium]|nr:polyamine ABC transporter substrate-binding protein [Xanthobacteraceae bacterium]